MKSMFPEGRGRNQQLIRDLVFLLSINTAYVQRSRFALAHIQIGNFSFSIFKWRLLYIERIWVPLNQTVVMIQILISFF